MTAFGNPTFLNIDKNVQSVYNYAEKCEFYGSIALNDITLLCNLRFNNGGLG